MRRVLPRRQNRLNRVQKEKVRQFCGIIGTEYVSKRWIEMRNVLDHVISEDFERTRISCDRSSRPDDPPYRRMNRERLALEALRCAEWNVENAIEMFYNGDIPSLRPVVDLKALESLFKKYKDGHHDLIMAEGVGQFCDDLGVDPSDIVMLVLSFHLKAATMCEYTHDEFVNGLARMGVDSLEKIRDRLPQMRTELDDPELFREIYAYAFLFSREKGQKSVMLDVAIEMWHLLFPNRTWVLLDEWCEFLKTHHNKAVSRDTWVQLLEFVKLGEDLSSYDPSGAWPYLIDEFVEHKLGETQSG